MRILLADDHRLLVEGLTNLLTAHGHDVVATASDGLEAVARTRVHRPDVVLMDVRMPRCDGLAATRLISTELPETRIVMLTTSGDDEDLFEAIRSGACGYLLKSVSGDVLIQSLAALEHEGLPPLSPGLAAKLLREFGRRANGAAEQPVPGIAAERIVHRSSAEPPTTDRGRDEVSRRGLNERQLEVLELVAAGNTYKEAAALLGLSERTVRYHMSEIMGRLHFEHRSQLLAYAGEAGLLGRHERTD